MRKYMELSEAESFVDEVLTRGVGEFIDPKGEFRKKMIQKATGEYQKDIVIKFGVDPTRPDIHLGHAVILKKLRMMQDIGCKIIFLIGDFTGLVGDPTGKSKVRPEIEQKDIESNMRTYLDQVGKILDVKRAEDGTIIHTETFSWIRNSDWFYSVTDIAQDPSRVVEMHVENKKIILDPNSFEAKAVVFKESRMQYRVLKNEVTHGVTFATILWVLRRLTLSQLIERDMFQDRIRQNEPLFMHEMMYPVMQGIDSDIIAKVYGSCDLEVGGTDQTFNMIMGRRVMEMSEREPQAVLAFELLVGTDGKEKMSKSLDNYIAVTDVPDDMFGKVMSIPDSALPKYLELVTYIGKEDLKRVFLQLEKGEVNPRDVKLSLAKQVVEMYHGKEAGEHAVERFIQIFKNKEIPEDIDTKEIPFGTLLSDALTSHGIVASKTEFRRLLEAGAIKRDSKVAITDPYQKIEENMVLLVGKHRFIRFTPQK